MDFSIKEDHIAYRSKTDEQEQHIQKAGTLSKVFRHVVKVQVGGHEIAVRRDQLIEAMTRIADQQLRSIPISGSGNQGIATPDSLKKAMRSNLKKMIKTIMKVDPSGRRMGDLLKEALPEIAKIDRTAIKTIEQLQADCRDLLEIVEKHQNQALAALPAKITHTIQSGQTPVTDTSSRLATVAHLQTIFSAEAAAGKSVDHEETNRYALATGRQLTWVPSDEFRDSAKRAALFPREGAATDPYLPCVVNARIDQLTQGDQVLCEVFRSGAITDPREPSTSLDQLDPNSKDYQDRRRWLELQMLQRISSQVESSLSALQNPNSSIRQSGQFVIGQVSLLNPDKRKETEGGFVHDEQAEMADMHEIFNLMHKENYTLEFDGSGPRIEGNKIYLPQRMEGVSLNLKAIFFNVNVQGRAVNTTKMQTYNRQNIALLYNLIPKDRQDWKDRLDVIAGDLAEGRSDYEVARDLLILMDDLGIRLGINCFSGKDRTGYLAMLFKLHHLHKAIDQNSSLNSRQRADLKRQIAKQMWSDQGVMRQVVKQNTGLLALKVTKPSLEGLSTVRRAWMAFQALSARA